MLRNKHIDSENCQTRRGMRPIYILASVILIFTLLGGGCDNSTKKNLPLDIVKNTFLDVDYNVFPLNPHWGDQENQGPGLLADTITCGPLGGAQDDPKNWKNCTSYPVTIERGNGCGPHVNCRPVTYTGEISWDSHSA